jgi:hypothetical protein
MLELIFIGVVVLLGNMVLTQSRLGDMEKKLQGIIKQNRTYSIENAENIIKLSKKIDLLANDVDSIDKTRPYTD